MTLDNETPEPFSEWAICELMGHRKLAGRVSEATLAGGAFFRIDVPGVPTEGEPDPVIATQFYSPAAVYCITPVSEEHARMMAKRFRPEPVSRYEIPSVAGDRGPF